LCFVTLPESHGAKANATGGEISWKAAGGKMLFSGIKRNWIGVPPRRTGPAGQLLRQKPRSGAMRTIARQQFGLVLTAAAFLFVGAVVFGIL
jgi:hypothetical protein